MRTGKPVAMMIAVGLMLTAGIATIVIARAYPPETERTDSERNQSYQKNWIQFQANYTSWLAKLDISKLDLHSLKRSHIAAAYLPPAPTLEDAVRKADIIMEVRIDSIRFTAFSGTFLSATAEHIYKGSVRAPFIIHQAGGLRPTPDGTGVYIAEAADAPFLLPGDRAFLFLQHAGAFYEAQGWTGTYRIVSGRLVPMRENPFDAALTGLGEAEFAARLPATS